MQKIQGLNQDTRKPNLQGKINPSLFLEIREMLFILYQYRPFLGFHGKYSYTGKQTSEATLIFFPVFQFRPESIPLAKNLTSYAIVFLVSRKRMKMTWQAEERTRPRPSGN